MSFSTLSLGQNEPFTEKTIHFRVYLIESIKQRSVTSTFFEFELKLKLLVTILIRK